nr:MAG TPA: hypothetical protein [Caudoviricetes sp.]
MAAEHTRDRRRHRHHPPQERRLQAHARHPGYEQDPGPGIRPTPVPTIPAPRVRGGTRVGWGDGMGPQHTARATAKKLAATQARNTRSSQPSMSRSLPHPGATHQYPLVEGRHRRPRRPLARGSMRPTRDRRRSCCRR